MLLILLLRCLAYFYIQIYRVFDIYGHFSRIFVLVTKLLALIVPASSREASWEIQAPVGYKIFTHQYGVFFFSCQLHFAICILHTPTMIYNIPMEQKQNDSSVRQPLVWFNPTITGIRRNAAEIIRILQRIWKRYRYLKVRAAIFGFWALCVLYIIVSLHKIRGNFCCVQCIQDLI